MILQNATLKIVFYIIFLEHLLSTLPKMKQIILNMSSLISNYSKRFFQLEINIDFFKYKDIVAIDIDICEVLLTTTNLDLLDK